MKGEEGKATRVGSAGPGECAGGLIMERGWGAASSMTA